MPWGMACWGTTHLHSSWTGGGQKESHVSSHELSMALPWWGASGFWVSRGYSCSEGCSPFQPLGAERQTYSVRSWPRASIPLHPPD